MFIRKNQPETTPAEQAAKHEKLIAEIKRRTIPPLHAQEETDDKILYLRYFFAGYPWVWYVAECEIKTDGDILFFGFGESDASEFGYFGFSAAECAKLSVVIDNDFRPMPFSEAKRLYGFGYYGFDYY